jgi:DNA-binding transcriptional ArsR family regulator
MFMRLKMEQEELAAIYELHASFCRTLSDANRLLMIHELGDSELPVGELSRRLGLTQPNVSKHLGMMREHGLVSTRREGSNIYYRLTDARISEAVRLLKAVQADQLERRRALTSGTAGI